MRPEFSAISFTCAGLLTSFIPLHRVRCNVSNLAIVSWLIGGNVIHGVNALVWARDINIHAPAWCDICRCLASLDGVPI